MAIDLGDGILTLLADTSQLETSLDKVDAQAAASGERSAQSLGPYTKALSDTGAAAEGAAKKGIDAGSSLADAFRLIPPVVQQSDSRLQDMSFSLRNIGAEAGKGLQEGKDHLADFGHGFALVNEASRDAIGVSLPRHVKEFLKELPGVASALSAAFEVTAVLFLIDAVVKVIEKIIEYSEHAKRVSEAWAKVDEVQRKALEGLENNVIKAQIRLDELTGKNLEALRLKLVLIDRTTLSGLEGELNKIATEADKVFKLMDRDWFAKLLTGSSGSKEVADEFDKIRQSVDTALNTRTPEAFAGALRIVDGALVKSKEELEKLNKQGEEFDKNRKNIGSNVTTKIVDAPDKVTIDAWEQLRMRVQGYKAAIEDAQTAEQKEKQAEKIVANRKATEDKIADLKRGEQVEVASIDLVKAKAQLAFQQREISAKQFAEIEVKAAGDARKANEDYLQKVIDLYKKAGAAKKAAAAQDELDKTKLQNAAKATQDLTNATKFAEQETAKWKKTSTDTVAEMEKFGEVEVTAPFNKIAKDALDLNKDLKLLGIQGWMPVRQQLAAVADAEKKFHAAGIHEGKLWLQVQIMKQKALIKLAQDSHQSTTKQIQDLKKLEAELRAYDGVVKESKSQVAAAWIGEALAAGFAADSVGAAGQAILASVLNSIAGQAFAQGTKELALGFAAMSPISPDFGHSGEHFTSAALWYSLGGAASVVGSVVHGGSSGGSSAVGAGGSAASIDHTQTQNQPVQNPVQTQNIQHLASGGFAVKPQMAVIGDVPEVVIPLHDARAVRAMMGAFMEARGGHSGCTHNIVVEGIPMHKLARKFSSDVNKGKVRIKSSDGLRVTRRY